MHGRTLQKWRSLLPRQQCCLQPSHWLQGVVVVCCQRGGGEGGAWVVPSLEVHKSQHRSIAASQHWQGGAVPDEDLHIHPPARQTEDNVFWEMQSAKVEKAASTSLCSFTSLITVFVVACLIYLPCISFKSPCSHHASLLNVCTLYFHVQISRPKLKKPPCAGASCRQGWIWQFTRRVPSIPPSNGRTSCIASSVWCEIVDMYGPRPSLLSRVAGTSCGAERCSESWPSDWDRAC